MNKNKKVEIINSRGITLIALVITIIVMLILVAVTISMAVNGGLFQYAGNATSDTKTKMEEEKKLAEIESGKDYEYLISKYTGELEALNPSGKIPEGATYTIASTETVLNPGDDFPTTTADGDIFLYGDYEYRYNMSNYSTGWLERNINGWAVRVKDALSNETRNKTSFGVLMQTINGVPIVCLDHTFQGCSKMTVAPDIPNTVTSIFAIYQSCTELTTPSTIPNGVIGMGNAFRDCTSLTTLPTIPSGVTSLDYTFYGCTALTTPPNIPNSVTNLTHAFEHCEALTSAPKIPSSVTNMDSAFAWCISLKGTIIIDANPSVYGWCFLKSAQDAEHAIVLKGTSTILNELKATGDNSGAFITIEQ